MWDETLAMDSTMFSLWAMSYMPLWSFGGAPLLQWSINQRLVSEGPLTGPVCSAAIDLSITFPFFDIGAPTTGMVRPFQRTVIHCCTESVLAPEAAIVIMLGRVGRCEYVGAGVGARDGRGATSIQEGCSLGLPATNCL